MSETLSPFDAQLIDITRKVVKRWGIECPAEPKDPRKAVLVALKKAIAVAKSKPFSPVYPDDHSWTALGLRGLTVARLKQDQEINPLEKAGEEWGVGALVEGFGNSVFVPLMADLAEETARSLVQAIEGNEAEFLDLDAAPALLREKSSDNSEEEISVSVVASLWDELREISSRSCLPLSEAVFFRRPVVWDLLRARLSGAKCPPLEKFREEAFQSRFDRSMKFDRRSTRSTLSILARAAERDVDLSTPKGRNWFALVVDGLNSLGLGKSMEGLSVLIHFEVLSAREGMSPALPEFLRFANCEGTRNLCIGYGLDPVQASYLLDLARENPSAFHTLDTVEDRQFVPIGASVVPDMHLAMLKATTEGRDAATYEKLVAATQDEREYLNA